MNLNKAKAYCRALPGAIPAPYLVRAKWVYIESPKAVTDAEARPLLKRSHELVFAKLTKKLQREIQGP